MKILVVEDNTTVASFVRQGLEEEGYSVDVAYDGTDGSLKAASRDYELLILDIMLPEKSGLEIVREVRQEEREIPILLLTARDSTEDVVRGLDAGGDDYVTKPFSFDVLLARVRALLRRGGSSRTEILQYRDVTLNRLQHEATRKGEELGLTPKEFELLEFFLLHTEEVVRRTELLEKVWGFQFDPGSNVVDVHVSNLRQKLREPDPSPLIHTVRGVGYRFAEEASE